MLYRPNRAYNLNVIVHKHDKYLKLIIPPSKTKVYILSGKILQT